MSDDIPTPAKGVYIYLDYTALGFVLVAVEEIFRPGSSWKVVALCFALGAVFLFFGIMGYRIKAALIKRWPGTRLAAALTENSDLRRQLAEAIASRTNPIDRKLKIHSAVYGLETKEEIDVTENIRSAIGDALAIRVDNALVPRDPALGDAKRLEIEYSYATRERKKISRMEGELMILPEDPWLEKRSAELSSQLNSEIARSNGYVIEIQSWKDSERETATRLQGVIDRLNGEIYTLRATESERQSKPVFAKFKLQYDRVLNHSVADDESQEVLWVTNTQLSVPFVAKYVSARIRFTQIGGQGECTITEAPWVYEHIDTVTGFIGSARPSWVDIEGSERQALVLAFKKADGTLFLRDSRGATAQFFPVGTSWNAEIFIVSDNTEPLTLKTTLIVYPNREFKWGDLAF